MAGGDRIERFDELFVGGTLAAEQAAGTLMGGTSGCRLAMPTDTQRTHLTCRSVYGSLLLLHMPRCTRLADRAPRLSATLK